MSKHTPGPWFMESCGLIWRRDPSDLYENGGGVAGDKPLAVAYEGWHGEGVQGYPVEANARLIAAAPELLEACKLIVSGQTKEGYIAANAAIAKAEGQSAA